MSNTQEDSERYIELSKRILVKRNLNAKSYERALTLAAAATRLEPDSYEFLLWRGIAEYRTGRFRAAIETLTRSHQLYEDLKIAPSRPSNLAFLCLAQLKLGELALAKKTHQRLMGATKGDPDFEICWFDNLMDELEAAMKGKKQD